MKAKLLLFISLVLPVVSAAQTVDQQKVATFATAVAHAEGFGVRQAIPTRYHNPGDIRSTSAHAYAGQVGLNKAGYVIFKNDHYGMKAFQAQIVLMATGQSKHFTTNMTLAQVAKIYTPIGWKAWMKNVTNELGVTPNTTLAAYFTPAAPQPEATEDAVLDFTAFGLDNLFPSEN